MQKFLYLLLLFYSSLYSAPIDITIPETKISILSQASIYAEPDRNASDETVMADPNKFTPNTKEFLHFGYTTDTIWVHFTFTNSSNSVIHKTLTLDNTMLDHISLFTKEDGNLTRSDTGVFHNRNFDDQILTFFYDLTLQPHESKDYFLRIQADSCPIFFRLDMMDKQTLYQQEMHHQLILMAFFAAMATLIIYNFFLYLFSKDTAYIWYVLYQVFLLQLHTSNSSMGMYFYFGWMPKWYLEFDAFAAIYYMALVTIFMVQFTRTYLKTRTYPKIDFTLKFFIGLLILIMLFTSPSFYPIGTVVNLLFGVMLFIILVGFYLYVQGVHNARYFILGWGILLTGDLMIISFYEGWWSILYTFPYFFEFCVFAEGVLFSIALAERLNKTKELERAVATQAVLTRELHHRVKNNMQFIISLYRLKLSDTLSSEGVSKIGEAENSIKAMSRIHELLYAGDALDEIDTKAFFSALVQEFEESSKSHLVKIDLKTQVDLSIDHAITCAIILNELITNALKYAFDDKGGEITIILNKEKDGYVMRVNDNGKGYDPQTEHEGFGLMMIGQLVENELQGSLDVKRDGGMRYTIRWS